MKTSTGDKVGAVHTPRARIVYDKRRGQYWFQFGDRLTVDIRGDERPMWDELSGIANAHDDMVEALRKSHEAIMGMKEMLNAAGMAYGLGGTWAAIEAALAKAEGGAR